MSKAQLIREIMNTDFVHEWIIALEVADYAETPCTVLDKLFELWAEKVPDEGESYADLFARILNNKNISRELHDKIVNSDACDIEDGEVKIVLTRSPMISPDMMDYLSKHERMLIRWLMSKRKDLSPEIVVRLLKDPFEAVRDMCKITHCPELSEDPSIARAYRQELEEERAFLRSTASDHFEVFKRLNEKN